MNFQEICEGTGLPDDVVSLFTLEGSGENHKLILKDITNRDVRIALSSDDVSVFREVCILTSTAMAGGALYSWAPTAIVTLIFLLLDFRKKSISLTLQQARVIQDIKKYPGISTDQLAALYGPVSDDELELKDCIESLMEVRRNDRTSVSILDCDENGGWYAVEGF